MLSEALLRQNSLPRLIRDTDFLRMEARDEVSPPSGLYDDGVMLRLPLRLRSDRPILRVLCGEPSGAKPLVSVG